MEKTIKILFLTAGTCAALLTGCGGNSQESENNISEAASQGALIEEENRPTADISEHVVLTMYCIGDEGGIYAQQHLDKLNEVLTEKINAEIEPIMVSWGDYKTKLPMVWASGETYDLTFTGSWVGYSEEAAKGAYMDITELFPAYAPLTYAEYQEKDLIETTRVDDKLYMVALNEPDYTTFMFNYREDLRKKYDCPEIDSWEDLETFMQAIKENEPGMLAYAIPGDDNVKTQTWLNEMDWSRPVDNSGSTGIFVYDLKNPDSVFNLIDTPEYEEYIMKSREYYEKGFWSQSVMAETTSVKDAFLTGKSALYAANMSNSNGVYIELGDSQPDWEIGIWSSDLASGNVERVAAVNGGIAVGAYSQNPERAMMLIELIHQDEEVYHILMDGLEGITFEADYEKMVKWIPETTDPADINLKNIGMGCNDSKFVLGSLNDSPLVTQLKEDYDEVGIFPELAGFAINSDAISAELAAIKSICEEYKIPLEKGVLNPEEGLVQLREKLKAAGADKVMEEINRQIAEFLAD